MWSMPFRRPRTCTVRPAGSLQNRWVLGPNPSLDPETQGARCGASPPFGQVFRIRLHGQRRKGRHMGGGDVPAKNFKAGVKCWC